MHNMSTRSKDSAPPTEDQGSSKESERRNGTKDEPEAESQEEKESPDALERMLHKSSGEMTYGSSVDGSEAFNYAKNYLTLSYLNWENNANTCWLDASMSLLVHNKSVRHLAESNPSSLVSKNIKWFDEAIALLNDDKNPKDIHLRELEARAMLKDIQDANLRCLQPLVKFVEGEPDSAFCSLYNLIAENKTTRALFEVEYALVLQCLNCPYYKSRPYKKPIVTLTKVQAFDPQAPMWLGACPSCKAPDQLQKLRYRSLPQSLVFHFESGAGKGEFCTRDFSLCERQYRLTGLMVLEKCQDDPLLNVNHFVSWIRDPLTDSWLECNDLVPEAVAFSVMSQEINLEDVCIAMYEAQDSKGTLPFGSSEEDPGDRVSNGEADIPFIDLSEDEGEEEKDDGKDGSNEKGSKVTSCKVQKTDLDSTTTTDSVESPPCLAAKSSKKTESAGPKAEIGDSETCERGKENYLSQETREDASKSAINNSTVSLPRTRRKMYESKVLSKEDRDRLLGEDLKFKMIMEKIQATRLRSSCNNEIQSESSVRESSPRKKLRSDANSDRCKMEKSPIKNDSKSSSASSLPQKEGDVNPAETGARSSPARRNRNLKQSEEVVLDASNMKEESKENLVSSNSQGVNASCPPAVKAVRFEASDLSSSNDLQVKGGKNKDPRRKQQSPSMPLLRRSCRARKFTPKVIESLRQSVEEKESDPLPKTTACKRKGQQPLNGFKSPQHPGRPAKVARKNLPGGPTVLDAAKRGQGSRTGLDVKSARSPADKVEKIFNPKEWEVCRIDPKVPSFITYNQRTVFPKSSASAPVKSYSEEVKGYLDLTLLEFKEKVKSEREVAPKNFQNGTTLTLVKSSNGSGDKTVENSSASKPRILSEIALVFGSDSSSGSALASDPVTIHKKSSQHKNDCKSHTVSKIKHAQSTGEGETSPARGSVENGISTSPGEISLLGSKLSPELQPVSRDTEKSSSAKVKAEDCGKVTCESSNPNCTTGAALPSVPLTAKRKVESGVDSSPSRKRTRSHTKCVPAVGEDCIHSTVENYFKFTCSFFQVDQSLFGKGLGIKR